MLLLVGVVLGPQRVGAEPTAAPDAPAVRAAEAWLRGLAPDKQVEARLRVDDPDRARWTYLPGRRRGVNLMTLDEAGRKRAFDLVRTGLSAAGWTRVEGIFALEAELYAGLPAHRRGGGSSWRHPQNYTLAIFGTPRVGGTWGWRLGGHHLSLNVGYEAGVLRATTISFGANPARVPSGARRGLEPLRDLLGGCQTLWARLPEAQRRQARESMRVPGDLVGRPGVSPWGLRKGPLALAQIGPEGRRAFESLVRTWAGSMAPAAAATIEAAFLRAAPEQVHFAWRGTGAPWREASFRLQAPGVHLELWKGGNHIHTVVHLAPAAR